MKRFINIGSLHASWYGHHDKTITSDDWADEKYLKGYVKTKYHAEKKLWEVYKKNQDKIEVVSLNAGLLLGSIISPE